MNTLLTWEDESQAIKKQVSKDACGTLHTCYL